jgi:hypothetical protein
LLLSPHADYLEDACPDYGLAGRTGTPLIKTPAGASIIVLLSIGLEVERQEVSGFFNITFTPV